MCDAILSALILLTPRSTYDMLFVIVLFMDESIVFAYQISSLLETVASLRCGWSAEAPRGWLFERATVISESEGCT